VPDASSVSLRRKFAAIFEDEEPRSAVTRAFNLALSTLIIANVSCVILESVKSIRLVFAPAFDALERSRRMHTHAPHQRPWTSSRRPSNAASFRVSTPRLHLSQIRSLLLSSQGSKTGASHRVYDVTSTSRPLAVSASCDQSRRQRRAAGTCGPQVTSLS
jgi:hypothetical protein